VPQIAWYATQREALGLEAAVYAYLPIGLSNPCFSSPSFPVCYVTNATFVAGACDEVVQWGFDETTLDGTACFNQWCLIRTGHGKIPVFLLILTAFACFTPSSFFSLTSSLLSTLSYAVSGAGDVHSIVTIECAGILPCSTAAETVIHIEKTWERGQTLHCLSLLHTCPNPPTPRGLTRRCLVSCVQTWVLL
jgi:hypothetical protein